MATDFVNRYSTTTNGTIIFTGNTLGLSKEEDVQDAGRQDSIGAMITTQTFLNVPTYPTASDAGTTLNFNENESFAYLNIPLGSTILYAELIWGGSYKFGDQDYTTSINKTVTFRTPLGVNTITLDAATSSEEGGYYLRSSNVTSLVSTFIGGSYKVSCGGVVGTTDISSNTDNACGWTLCVAFQNPILPSRNLSLYVGGTNTFVSTSQDATSVISGFNTPSSGIITASVHATALEGDANRVGDQAQILKPGGDPNEPTDYNPLSGLNNPVNNFFCSQINNNLGQLDTTGSFGNQNQNAITQQNIVAGRQGWDITTVDGNPTGLYFTFNQTSTTVRFTTSGDRYWVTGFALELDVNSPRFTILKEVSPIGAVEPLDILTYTVTVKNIGSASTNGGAIIGETIHPGTSFVAGSLSVTPGTLNYTVPDPLQPATISVTDPIAVGDEIKIVYSVQVTDPPVFEKVDNTATIDYTYPIPGNPENPGSGISNTVVTPIDIDEEPVFTIVKEVVPEIASVGDVLTYTITINSLNTGVEGPTNINTTVTDSIPTGTAFIEDSLQVISPRLFSVDLVINPITVVFTQPILPGDTITIIYEVKVISRPQSATVENSAFLGYTFSPDNIIGEETSNTVTTFITAEPPPIPPIVPNYTATTCNGQPVTGQVVGTDFMGSMLSYSLNSSPSHGVATVAVDGVWKYTPFVGYSGLDSFTVKVTNSSQVTAISTITVTVSDKLCCKANCEKCGCNSCCR